MSFYLRRKSWRPSAIVELILSVGPVAHRIRFVRPTPHYLTNLSNFAHGTRLIILNRHYLNLKDVNSFDVMEWTSQALILQDSKD